MLKLDTPQARIFPAARRFSNAGHDAGEVGHLAAARRPVRPVQQIEIEMISAETREARVAGARHAVSARVRRPYLCNQKYAVALTGNHAADQLLGAAVAIHFRGVDQRHPERKAGAQGFFLDRWRMPSLAEAPGSLAERRHDGSVAQLYRPPRARRGRARGDVECRCA